MGLCPACWLIELILWLVMPPRFTYTFLRPKVSRWGSQQDSCLSICSFYKGGGNWGINIKPLKRRSSSCYCNLFDVRIFLELVLNLIESQFVFDVCFHVWKLESIWVFVISRTQKKCLIDNQNKACVRTRITYGIGLCGDITVFSSSQVLANIG